MRDNLLAELKKEPLTTQEINLLLSIYDGAADLQTKFDVLSDRFRKTLPPTPKGFIFEALKGLGRKFKIALEPRNAQELFERYQLWDIVNEYAKGLRNLNPTCGLIAEFINNQVDDSYIILVTFLSNKDMENNVLTRFNDNFYDNKANHPEGRKLETSRMLYHVNSYVDYATSPGNLVLLEPSIEENQEVSLKVKKVHARGRNQVGEAQLENRGYRIQFRGGPEIGEPADPELVQLVEPARIQNIQFGAPVPARHGAWDVVNLGNNQVAFQQDAADRAVLAEPEILRDPINLAAPAQPGVDYAEALREALERAAAGGANPAAAVPLDDNF